VKKLQLGMYDLEFRRLIEADTHIKMFQCFLTSMIPRFWIFYDLLRGFLQHHTMKHAITQIVVLVLQHNPQRFLA